MGESEGVRWSFVNRGLRGRFEDVLEELGAEIANGVQLPWEQVVGLNVQGNAIRSLAGVSDMLVNLEELNVAANDVSKIEPGDLAGLHALRNLNMASNSLRRIDAGSLPPLPRLVHLDLSYNILENIDGVSVLAALQTLDVRNNKLSDTKTLSSLGLCLELETLLLEGNPICSEKSLPGVLTRSFKKLSRCDVELDSGKQEKKKKAAPASTTPVHTPYFDQAAERFIRRTESAATTNRRRGRRIIHSRILRQTSLSRFQREILQSHVQDHLCNAEFPEIRSSIDSDKFRQVLSHVGINIPEENIEAFRGDDGMFDGELVNDVLNFVVKRNASQKLPTSLPSRLSEEARRNESGMQTSPRRTQESATQIQQENTQDSNGKEILLEELQTLKNRFEEQSKSSILKRKIADLESKVANLFGSTDLHVKLEQAEARSRERDRQHDADLAKEREESQHRISALEEKLEVSRIGNQRLFEELGQERAQHLASVEQIRFAKARVKTLEEQIRNSQEVSSETSKHLSDRVDSLASQLALAEARRDEMEAQARDRAQEATELGFRFNQVLEENNRLKASLSEIKTERSEEKASLTAQIAELKHRNEIVEAEFKDGQLRFSESKKSEVRSNNENLKLKSDLEQALQVVQNQKRQLLRLVETVRKKDSKIAEMEIESSQVVARHATEIDQTRTELEQLRSLKMDIDEEHAKTLRAKAEAEKAQDDLLIAQKEMEQLRGSIKESQSVIRVKDKMLDDQNDSMTRLAAEQKRNRTLQNQFDRAEEDLRHLRDKFEEAEETIRNLEDLVAEHDKVAEDMEQLRKTAEKYEATKADLKRRTQALEAVEREMSQIREQYSNKDHQIKELEEELDKETSAFQKQKTELASELAEHRADMEIRNRELSRLRLQLKEIESELEEIRASESRVKGDRDRVFQENEVLARALEAEKRRSSAKLAKFEALLQELRRP